MNFIIFYYFSSKNRFFFVLKTIKNPKFSKFRFFSKKSEIFKKIEKLQNALKSRIFEIWTRKKSCNEIYRQKSISKKISDARQKPHYYEIFQNDLILAVPLEISSGARAEASARRKFFEIRKVQIILHPLAIFGFSISLKVSVIERFEKSAVLVPKPRIRVKEKMVSFNRFPCAHLFRHIGRVTMK